jgi:hypothetical protein
LEEDESHVGKDKQQHFNFGIFDSVARQSHLYIYRLAATLPKSMM